MKNLKEYIYKLRVYYEDTDAGGVVYHASYIRFMERARSEMLIQHKLAVNMPHCSQNCEGYMPVFAVSELAIKYTKPARLYDLLEVVSKVAQLSKVSIIFEQTIKSAYDLQMVFCTAKVKVVSVNRDMKLCRINPKFLEALCYDA